MTQEELSVLVEKIKDGTATKEETLAFYEKFNELLSQIKGLLE